MPTELDIHPAARSERLQAYRNVHEVWGGGVDLDAYVRWRVESVQHNRATWFVGCLAGRVVTSLGCYPLRFRLCGTIEPGMAIGAVHTVPAHRGRGYAPQLIRWVEEYQQQRGTKLSLLYSDIDPDYYARLGYRICSSWHGRADQSSAAELLASPPPESSGFKLLPSSAPDQWEMLADFYQQYHSGFAISISRNADYWKYLLAKDRDDLFFWLHDSASNRRGYVRVGPDGNLWKIRDVGLDERCPNGLRTLLSELIRAGRARGVESISGWLPDKPAVRALFRLVERRDEVTMLKSLDRSISLPQHILADAQNFCEIDHV